VPLGVNYWAFWQLPRGSSTSKFAYYLIIFSMLQVVFTAVNLPYTALTPDIARTYKQRSSLNVYRFSFSILFGLVAVLIHGVISAGGSSRTGTLASAVLFGGFIAFSPIVTALVVKERERDQAEIEMEKQADIGFFQGLKLVGKNYPFVLCAGMYVTSWMALALIQSNLKFFVDDVMQAEPNVLLVAIGILMIMALLCLPIWAFLSGILGKREAYLISLVLWTIIQISLTFTPGSQRVVLYVQSAFAGAFASGSFVIPWSMLPDTIDLDELNTNKRREGAFYSFFVFFQNFGIAGGLALSNLFLDTQGYVILDECPSEALVKNSAGENIRCLQTANAQNAVRALVSYIPMILIVVSAILTFFYPLSQQKLTEIQEKLKARKDAQPTVKNELQKVAEPKNFTIPSGVALP